MKNGTHQLKFWGVRGSIPTADPDQVNFGGNTSCVDLMHSDGRHIIFDAGTGIRGLGNLIAREHDDSYEVHLFLSHTHWDHILGLPFFAPIHQPKAHVHIYGPQRGGKPLKDTILGLFESPYFPLNAADLNAKFTFHDLKEADLQIDTDFRVICAPHPHPNGALTFRIELDGIVLTYITDIEHTRDRLVPSVIELARGADAMIHDSHFHAEDLSVHSGWGHSSWEESTEVAIQAQAKQLFLFHFSPNYSDYDIFDMEFRAKKRFPNTIAAYQGLEVDLPFNGV